MKITVVHNKNDNKLIPFKFGDYGEIILLSIDPTINLDDCIVSNVDIDRIDFIENRILSDEQVEIWSGGL